MRYFNFIAFIAVVFHLAFTSATNPSSTTKRFSRMLLQFEEECKGSTANFKPGKTKELKSKSCGQGATLTDCICTSDSDDVIGTSDVLSGPSEKQQCSCSFENVGIESLKKINIEACAVCEEQADECEGNSDCTDYDKFICDKKATPRVCVQCTKNEQCDKGEKCKSNVCISK